MSISPTMQYTGHPFIDAGIAIMEHYLGKECASFSEDDIKKATQWLTRLYKRKDVKGYLTVHFPNSGWCNATISTEKKDEYINRILKSYKAKTIGERKCVYCHRPAQFLADRQHIPLLTGKTTIITSPGGVPGLPVCGYCLLAVQFYPLATLKCQGKPLFWWTPEAELLSELTGEYHRELVKMLAGGSDKIPNLSWPRTRLLNTAHKVLKTYGTDQPLADCIGFHVTNYGSGPDYHQYRIPKELLEFLSEIMLKEQEVRNAHSYIVENAWEKEKKVGKKKNTSGENAVESRRNLYYEALVKTFEDVDWHRNVRNVIRTFFLYDKPEQFHHNNFELSRFFLEKVGGMEKQRLEVIKRIADQIATYLVLENNEKKWLNDLYYKEFKPSRFTNYLIKAQKSLAEKGQVFTLDDILIMLDLYSFDDTVVKDFWLVRDLFLIRLLEVVGKNKRDMLDELDFSDDTEIK
ncbi:CRISPR-associated protein Cst1 [Desulfotomaculum defluvii]